MNLDARGVLIWIENLDDWWKLRTPWKIYISSMACNFRTRTHSYFFGGCSNMYFLDQFRDCIRQMTRTIIYHIHIFASVTISPSVNQKAMPIRTALHHPKLKLVCIYHWCGFHTGKLELSAWSTWELFFAFIDNSLNWLIINTADDDNHHLSNCRLDYNHCYHWSSVITGFRHFILAVLGTFKCQTPQLPSAYFWVILEKVIPLQN